MAGMSNDLCRTVGLALGAALALVLLIALTGPFGFLGALLVALVAGGLLVILLNRFICEGAAGQGPVQASGRETREAVAAPAGEMQPQAATPVDGAESGNAEAPQPKTPKAGAALPEAVVSGEAPEAAPEVASAVASPAAQEIIAQASGPADDLQRLKGVGPKLAQALEEAGIRSFAQIARWSEADVAWVEENVKGARGRIGRDGWIAQAQDLEAAERAE
ncbi:helix-hairpin-helix domain-containing protein [Oceanicola sp. S124]|uniref:helix-hairpin-helix domain-containing protein n=1 Tax=Oceanicola sp. S124 TaxID=1042378 RepID=UPI0002559709|nr:helix-hairpin-helix domain-containing protein [Oceanicola sp. S124]